MLNEPPTQAEEVRRMELYEELGKLSVVWCFKKGAPITMEGLLKEKETLAKLLGTTEERVLELYAFLMQETQKMRLITKKPSIVKGFLRNILRIED